MPEMGSGDGKGDSYLQEDPLLSSGAAATTTPSAASTVATSLGPGLGIAIPQTTWHLQQSHTFPARWWASFLEGSLSVLP